MSEPKFGFYFLGVFGFSLCVLVCIFVGIYLDIPALLVLAGSFASYAGFLIAEYFAQKRLFGQMLNDLAKVANATMLCKEEFGDE